MFSFTPIFVICVLCGQPAVQYCQIDRPQYGCHILMGVVQLLEQGWGAVNETVLNVRSKAPYFPFNEAKKSRAASSESVSLARVSATNSNPAMTNLRK
jgi:hypothetical protein